MRYIQESRRVMEDSECPDCQGLLFRSSASDGDGSVLAAFIECTRCNWNEEV